MRQSWTCLTLWGGCCYNLKTAKTSSCSCRCMVGRGRDSPVVLFVCSFVSFPVAAYKKDENYFGFSFCLCVHCKSSLKCTFPTWHLYMQSIWGMPETEEKGKNFNKLIEFNVFAAISNWINPWVSSPGQSWAFLGSEGSAWLKMLPNQCFWLILSSMSVITPCSVPTAPALLVQEWTAAKVLGSHPEDP